MRITALLLAAFLLVPSLPAQTSPAEVLEPEASSYLLLAGQLDGSLRADVVEAWFPRSADEEGGGFRAAFSRDWTTLSDDEKTTVFQARMTWAAAHLASRRPQFAKELLPQVRRGLAMLEGKLWDARQGGFFWRVRPDGTAGDPAEHKHAYPQAFGIFAAAAAWEATGDQHALDLAIRAFRWIDGHAHDATNGGYFESFRRDGTPLTSPVPTPDGYLRFHAYPAGFKTSDTHLHLLEAFTALYRVWKDPTLRSRLEELLAIQRDRFAVAPGLQHSIAHGDWRPIPGPVSHGHAVEAAWLMIEAAEALGNVDERTSKVARSLVDHALALAFDADQGGLAGSGPALLRSRDQIRTWWVQMEALNALLVMHIRHGRETQEYWQAFQKQWSFIRTKLTDTRYGGFFQEVSAEGRRLRPEKGSEWKGAYHDGRALVDSADRLRALAAQTSARR